MGASSRELEADVMGILYDEGAKVIGKGRDGAGHQKVTFRLHGTEMTFHFPYSTHLNGNTRRNIGARLRRILREIPPSQEVDAKPQPVAVMEEPMIVPVPTPPKARLTIHRRKEIAKRYVVLRDFDKLLSETGLARHQLHILLNAAGGDAQRLYRRDLNKARMKTSQQPSIIKDVVVKAKKVASKLLPDLPPARRGAYADNFRRHVLIARMVYVENLPLEVVAKHAGVTTSRISQIAKANYEHRKWKFD